MAVGCGMGGWVVEWVGLHKLATFLGIFDTYKRGLWFMRECSERDKNTKYLLQYVYL
jgi:hypothetical protein